MNIILAAGIILIVLSIVFIKKWPPYWGFLIVFLIMGFQDNVEGDYVNYKDEYEQIAVNHIADSRTMEDEPVMPVIESFVSYLGPFWLFVLLMSLFQAYVLTEFVKRYCPKPYQFLAAILFFFTFNMMLLQMKAMRQGLAIEMMMAAFMLADRKKHQWISLVVAVMAYYTHNSSLLVLPFFLVFFYISVEADVKRFLRKLGIIKGKVKESSVPKVRKEGNVWSKLLRHPLTMPALMVTVYLVMYYFKITVLNQYMIPLMILTGGNNRLAGYADTTNIAESLDANLFEISPLIVLYDAVIVFLVSAYYKSAGPRMRVFCAMSIAAAFGDMLFFGAGTFARMIMYYVVFNLAVYPAVALRIKRKFGKKWALVFAVFLLGYAVKTSLPWITGMEPDRFGNYQFIFMP